jgi:hypothetical protein
MRNNKQSGFSIGLVILIIAIVLLTGAVGWLVWDRIQNNKVVTMTTEPVTEKKPESTKAIPDGFVEYKNQEYGIKFVYPKEWGEVSTQPEWEQNQGHLTAGKGMVILFSGNNNITAATRSVDWTHNPEMGHGGMDSSSSLAPTNSSNQFSLSERTNYQVYKNDSTTAFALTPLCQEGGCTKMGLILVKKLNNNKLTRGVAFVYSPNLEIRLDPMDETGMQNNVNALPWAANFPESLINQFKTIDTSISNL